MAYPREVVCQLMNSNKKITVSVHPALATKIRLWAAKHGKSVSRMIAEVLEKHVNDDLSYEMAMSNALGKEAALLGDKSTPLPTRDQIHERD